MADPRQPTDHAHYLHARVGIEPLIRPPVHDVAAMAWTEGHHLVVGTHGGEGYVIHPVRGTKPLWTTRSAILALATSGDAYTVVEAGGRWRHQHLDRGPLHEGTHSFIGNVRIQHHGGSILLSGDTASDRRLEVVVAGRRELRVLLPENAICVVTDDIRLARSSERGLELLPITPGLRFRGTLSTDHTLLPEPGHVVGVGHDDVCVWTHTGQLRARIPMVGATTATLSPDGRFLAIGTVSGGIAWVDLASDAHAPPPTSPPATVHITGAPITALALHRRWLASGADTTTLWQWHAR